MTFKSLDHNFSRLTPSGWNADDACYLSHKFTNYLYLHSPHCTPFSIFSLLGFSGSRLGPLTESSLN